MCFFSVGLNIYGGTLIDRILSSTKSYEGKRIGIRVSQMSAFASCEFVNLRVFFFGANDSQIRKITIVNRLTKFGKTCKL